MVVPLRDGEADGLLVADLADRRALAARVGASGTPAALARRVAARLRNRVWAVASPGTSPAVFVHVRPRLPVPIEAQDLVPPSPASSLRD